MALESGPELGGHGQEFGHELVSESVSEADSDSDTRFFGTVNFHSRYYLIRSAGPDQLNSGQSLSYLSSENRPSVRPSEEVRF